jgi:hypothetical protein
MYLTTKSMFQNPAHGFMSAKCRAGCILYLHPANRMYALKNAKSANTGRNSPNFRMPAAKKKALRTPINLVFFTIFILHHHPAARKSGASIRGGTMASIPGPPRLRSGPPFFPLGGATF